MPHPLDNPVWSTLTSGNQTFALGNDQAKYYPPQVAQVMAMAGRHVESGMSVWRCKALQVRRSGHYYGLIQ